MRKLIISLLVLGSLVTKGQVYDNEWIDYTKTYYKFKLGSDGVYRISGATLAGAGLASAPAEQFQLWRNGVQIPLYTTLPSGPLAANDYIEFWGQRNDGKPDKELYRDTSFQLNDKWSMISDSSAYFLTVNPSGPNLRFQSTPNNVAANTLPVEPYFMYTAAINFRDRLNPGAFYLVGDEHLYSSSYDRGEGWTSADIVTYKTSNVTTYGALPYTLSNLFQYPTGPAPSFKISVGGNAYSSRQYRVSINGDTIMGSSVPYLTDVTETANFNLSTLNPGYAYIVVTNMTDDCGTPTCATDRMIVHKMELTYPRQFNFGGQPNFEFSLPANVAGNYLEISGFNHGGIPPVLNDITNGKRYVGELAGGLVKFALEPSFQNRKLILINQAAVGAVASLQPKNFTDYKLTQNQADFIIISNPNLFKASDGSNPVEDYRAYRSSPIGGGYTSQIYLDEEVIDQFGFGIRKNPAGIRNFIRYARNTFSSTPKFVFIIGRGVQHRDQLTYEAYTPTVIDNLNKLNEVPTFGWPASDMLLAAEPGTSYPATPIGRLTAITPDEVAVYLKKVKETELAQQTTSPLISDKVWMKNVAHIVGAGEAGLSDQLENYMRNYKRIIQDTLYGAKVSTFSKSTSNLVQQLNDADLANLWNQGLSLVTYYGHSSAVSLEFNLDEPANYNNQGKYPMFLALGCNAGNTFDYNETRFIQRNYLSDKYVFAPNRGSINFIASTHFGIVHYLDIWNSRAYINLSSSKYGKSIGEVMQKTIADVFSFTTPDDFFARCNSEQSVLNGDPAIKFNQQSKPDYVIVDSMLKVSPNFISVAELSFKVSVDVVNLGKAINKKIILETKRQYPDGSISVVRRDTLDGTHYLDAITFDLPVDATRDKGTNKIFVTIDAENAVDELYETNNTASREFVIYENELRPVYPYNYAIVNKQNITLKASTADPFLPSKLYTMELDTTELFNSPFKKIVNVTAPGGLVEFNPGVIFTDSTVYYWRSAQVPASGPTTWNTASFVYLSNSSVGVNQSHYFQHKKSSLVDMDLAAGSKWGFRQQKNNLFIRSGVFITAVTQAAEFSISVNGASLIRSVCSWPSIIVNVFDQNTFRPWFNANAGQPGQFGSDPVCGADRMYNFQYLLSDSSKRRKLVEFLEMIPPGNFVAIRNFSTSDPNNNVFVNVWKGDTTALGKNRSIYHHFYNQGFTDVDSFYRPRAFIFTYKKDAQASVAPKSLFSSGIYDKISMPVDYYTPDTLGFITSPNFGPAKSWKEFKWSGNMVEPNNLERALVSIIGIKTDGTVDTLVSNIDKSQTTVDISSIDASVYPYLKLYLNNMDSVYHTPYQLKYWRLTYDPVPEGAVMPNTLFSMKDTLEVGEPQQIKLGFKNVSDAVFTDSMVVKVTVFDHTNSAKDIPIQKMKKPLNSDEVLTTQFTLDTKKFPGANTLYVEVNPIGEQQEQYHFNNFIFRNFYVKGDTLSPQLDVTFDNVHILNRDIVSAKPDILIKLKDEAKWMLLNDPSFVNVQVRFPDGHLQTYAYNSDTLMFTPATVTANGNNTASVRLKAYFKDDGDYELIITGKDASENKAGTVSYKVGFQVINKAMISNMLNYPNPFTTSTAFVFTLTGVEVPQNIKIEILTVTGKIVREITKAELGPLRIGRNITEFKWDGTDQYGQKLANGVYLYRVVTNLNGKSLEKYKDAKDDTNKYFNKGYGKMYLMR